MAAPALTCLTPEIIGSTILSGYLNHSDNFKNCHRCWHRAQLKASTQVEKIYGERRSSSQSLRVRFKDGIWDGFLSCSPCMSNRLLPCGGGPPFSWWTSMTIWSVLGTVASNLACKTCELRHLPATSGHLPQPFFLFILSHSHQGTTPHKLIWIVRSFYLVGLWNILYLTG